MSKQVKEDSNASRLRPGRHSGRTAEEKVRRLLETKRLRRLAADTTLSRKERLAAWRAIPLHDGPGSNFLPCQSRPAERPYIPPPEGAIRERLIAAPRKPERKPQALPQVKPGFAILSAPAAAEVLGCKRAWAHELLNNAATTGEFLGEERAVAVVDRPKLPGGPKPKRRWLVNLVWLRQQRRRRPRKT